MAAKVEKWKGEVYPDMFNTELEADASDFFYHMEKKLGPLVLQLSTENKRLAFVKLVSLGVIKLGECREEDWP
jgi:hypothetical protein